jgi:thiamine kinase-like enzyme
MGELNDIVQRLESSLGPLSGEPAPLEGGITNRNYRVTLGERRYVIRQPGKDTNLLGIDREAERLANETAAGLGIAPAVAAALEDCLVTDFIACRSVGSHEIAAAVEQIARALRSFHDSPARLPASFHVPHLLERYAAVVAARGETLPDGYAELVDVASRITTTLALARARPCHNDLLAGNIIRAQDDGRMMIVDWEYAGMGDPRFDLGNLSVNNGFDESVDERLLLAYHDEAPSDARRAALKLMRVLSDTREAAWGIVQGAISELDFDFQRYAQDHLDRLRASVEAPDFGDWLDSAGQ